MNASSPGREDALVLRRAFEHACAYLDGVAERPVGPSGAAAELRAAIGGPLPESPIDPVAALDALVAAVTPGIVATAGPRYFGFVTGGALPISVAADWLTAAWDQNAAAHVMSPALSIVEETAGRWVTELLGLPAGVSYGFVTGATMANWTGLAAARHELLSRTGWDVEADGLTGAPAISVIVGEERHATIDLVVRYLGLGTNAITVVPADAQGRLDVGALPAALEATRGRPTIVCAQSGNVNTGAFDPIGAICDLAHAPDVGAWVHVDGAVGAWVAAVAERRHLVVGWNRADSWATDAHKGLNVPYDCGIVLCAHPEAHRAACAWIAPYLGATVDGRDNHHWAPESSRRARALPVYAALAQLGRNGVAEMVDRCCVLASRFADRLRLVPGVEICNDVASNQVLVRFDDSDTRTAAVVAAVQSSGECWMGATVWKGRAAMRISVSNWSTTEADVDRSVAAIVRAVAATKAAP